MALKKRTIRKITRKTVTRTTVRRTIAPAVNVTPLKPRGEWKTYTTEGRVVKVTPLKPRGKRA